MDRYKIIRFFKDGEAEVIDRDLSLEEAQAHCRRADTRGDDWFDGYDHDDEDEPLSQHWINLLRDNHTNRNL